VNLGSNKKQVRSKAGGEAKSGHTQRLRESWMKDKEVAKQEILTPRNKATI
jgi:hypothetical protein